MNDRMIAYGFSLTGKSHVARGVCCQDSHTVMQLDNGWYFAAVADGVGSAKNAQIGSRIAVETVAGVCEEFMPWNYDAVSIKSLIRTAFNYALKQIQKESGQSGEPLESYDTTLSMVLYDGHRIFYGHSGDGAILGLDIYGNYVSVTTPQKGPDGVSVIPLRAGPAVWDIGTYDEELATVLLMTDGMLDIFCPYLLRDTEHGRSRIYIPLASFFGDPLCFGDGEMEAERAKAAIGEFLRGEEDFEPELFYAVLERAYGKRVGASAQNLIDELKEHHYPLIMMQGVQDDKTIVALIHADLTVEDREEDFYREPDWAKLKKAWNRKAYPHLYADETSCISED